MAQQNAIADLFTDTLKDVLSAEKQILRALPRMARAAQSDELREAFETHRDQTQDQIERIEQIFGMIGQRASGPTCEAMEAILSEGTEMMEGYKGTEALDAGLIASGQSVEHYEISRYRALKGLAARLQLNDAVTLLDETLKEEKETDRILTEIAESGVNQTAQGAKAEVTSGKSGGAKPGSTTASSAGSAANAGVGAAKGSTSPQQNPQPTASDAQQQTATSTGRAGKSGK